MDIKILGSGGYLRLPVPTCQCDFCQQARDHIEFRRLATCVYVPAINTLFDTPEDVFEAMNYGRLSQPIQNIFYSHWHPDHMAGWRVLESLFEVQKKPINVFLTTAKDREIYPGFSYLEKRDI